MARSTFSLIAFGTVLCCAAAWSDDSNYQSLLAARKAFDDTAFLDAHKRLVKEAGANTNDYAAQLNAAESFRFWATRLRNERTVSPLDDKEDKELRRKQAELATEGMTYAERAVELAGNDAQSAHAHRVVGELYSHQIKGMISGMRNGPKAKAHINLALDLTPDEPECLRAIGLMYLHNPPISGGDVPRAIETFTRCSKLAPSSDVYPVLLALAYRKAGDDVNARRAAEHALELNPKNKDARAFLNGLDRQSE